MYINIFSYLFYERILENSFFIFSAFLLLEAIKEDLICTFWRHKRQVH